MGSDVSASKLKKISLEECIDLQEKGKLVQLTGLKIVSGYDPQFYYEELISDLKRKPSKREYLSKLRKANRYMAVYEDYQQVIILYWQKK